MVVHRLSFRPMVPSVEGGGVFPGDGFVCVDFNGAFDVVEAAVGCAPAFLPVKGVFCPTFGEDLVVSDETFGSVVFLPVATWALPPVVESAFVFCVIWFLSWTFFDFLSSTATRLRKALGATRTILLTGYLFWFRKRLESQVVLEITLTTDDVRHPTRNNLPELRSLGCVDI